MEQGNVVRIIPKTRKCHKCKNIYELSESCFNRRLDGFQYLCRTCDNSRNQRRSKLRNGKGLEKVKTYRKSLKGRFQAYKQGAKARGLPFELTHENFKELWKNPCSYCGSEIETIGLDRIDSSLGYTRENIIPCCVVCNRAKHAMTTKQFLDHIKKIFEHYF